MKCLRAAQPGVPLYWFLISKGYRTYRYLSVYARRYYPHHAESTPATQQRLLDAMARHKFREAYDPATGLIRFAQSQGHLRPALAGVRDGLLERPEVRFFLARNPRYGEGDELACMTELRLDNLRSHAQRAFAAGLSVVGWVGTGYLASHPLALATTLAGYGLLLRDRHFLGLVFIGAFGVSSFFAYLGADHFLAEDTAIEYLFYHVLDPAVPFGGYKMSGYGREGGAEHLDEYLNTKSVWLRLD